MVLGSASRWREEHGVHSVVSVMRARGRGSGGKSLQGKGALSLFRVDRVGERRERVKARKEHSWVLLDAADGDVFFTKPLKSEEEKTPTLSLSLSLARAPTSRRPKRRSLHYQLRFLDRLYSSREERKVPLSVVDTKSKRQLSPFAKSNVDARRRRAPLEPPPGPGAAAEARHARVLRALGAGPAGQPGGARCEPARGRDGEQQHRNGPFSHFFLWRFRKRGRTAHTTSFSFASLSLSLVSLSSHSKTTRSRSPRASPWERSSRPSPPPSSTRKEGRRRGSRRAASSSSPPPPPPPLPPARRRPGSPS